MHPTQKLTSMNLLQMKSVMTQAKLFLTSEVMEAARGQKYHEGVDLLKRVFNESFSAPSKTPWRIQLDLSYDLRLERYSDLRGHSMYIATRRAHLEARGAGFLVLYNLDNHLVSNRL